MTSSPSFEEARPESTESTPLPPAESGASLIVFRWAGRPELAFLIKVQLSGDEDERWDWSAYLGNLRSHLGCPCALLLVTPETTRIRWCTQPTETSPDGFVQQTLVATREVIPAVTDEQTARQNVELAVLSAMVHGKSEVGYAIARAVLPALLELDDEHACFYFDLVFSSLSDKARCDLAAFMQGDGARYQGEIARKCFNVGFKQGFQEGLVSGLLRVLDSRGLTVDAEARQRILACTQLEQLRLWLRRAVTVQSVQELFEP